MYINSKIIKPTDRNIHLSVTPSRKSTNKYLILSYLRRLIESQEFHNNCCLLDITYKEKGKYKTATFTCRCNSDSITSLVSCIINEISDIRVEVSTSHGHTKHSVIFVVLVND